MVGLPLRHLLSQLSRVLAILRHDFLNIPEKHHRNKLRHVSRWCELNARQHIAEDFSLPTILHDHSGGLFEGQSSWTG